MDRDFTIPSKLKRNIATVIVGKESTVERLLVALLAEGHVMMEDVPGLGKTLLAKALALSMGGIFKRVQFTPDLLPADITGFNIYDQKSGRFSFQPGPVMSNVLLADEINRTVPRTQASLLESMEEKQVTIDGQSHRLPLPFMVLATQNPIEQEGTFPLPEAQLDRFLLKLSLGYPTQEEEQEIMRRFQVGDPLETLKPVTCPEEVAGLQKTCRAITVSEPIRAYIARLVQATRIHPAIAHGASPRGSLGLMRATQALAMLNQRDYVIPDDVKKILPSVLAHRLILAEDRRLAGESPHGFLAEIMEEIEPPSDLER